MEQRPVSGPPSNPVSAGVVVVRKIEGEWHYLLLRAYEYWDFPKGLVEDGEERFDAAIREVEEETTLTNLVFRWGYVRKETRPYGKFRKIALYFIAESSVGEVDLPISEELGRPEHEEFRWVSYAQAESMVSPRVRMVLDWAVRVINDEGAAA